MAELRVEIPEKVDEALEERAETTGNSKSAETRTILCRKFDLI